MVNDETCLQCTGGIINNCLNNILSIDNTIDENNELPIIRAAHHYYDLAAFSLLTPKM